MPVVQSANWGMKKYLILLDELTEFMLCTFIFNRL